MNTPDINERLESIENLLLAIVPWHKLTASQKEKLGPIMERANPKSVGDSGERVKFAKREYLKLVNLSPAKRKAAKFPKVLIPEIGDVKGPMPCVPLSILVNRCRARKCFAPVTGEESAADNVIDAIAQIGLVTATLDELGILKFSDVRVVLTDAERSARNPISFPDTDDEDEEEEDEPIKWTARAGSVREQIEADLDEDEAPVIKPKKEKPAVWGGIVVEEEEEKKPTLAERMKAQHEKEVADGTYAAHVGSFEESDCAQGVGRFNPRDEPDESGDIPDLEEDDDLIEDDDDWGPDEVDTHNPVKEQFEREAAEAAAREEEAERLMSTGDYYLKNGVVTRKAGR